MFTGIVEEKGSVRYMQLTGESGVLAVKAKKVLERTKIGDSIAVNGVCLTVTSLQPDGFTADVMAETIRRSSLGSCKVGSQVNLERAMAADGRFGGHIVSGHIDGTGVIRSLTREENAIWVSIGTSPLTISETPKETFQITPSHTMNNQDASFYFILNGGENDGNIDPKAVKNHSVNLTIEYIRNNKYYITRRDGLSPGLLSGCIHKYNIVVKDGNVIITGGSISGWTPGNEEEDIVINGEEINRYSFDKNETSLCLEEYMKPIFKLCEAKLEQFHQPFINLRLWNMDEKFSSKAFNEKLFQKLSAHFKIELDAKNIYEKGLKTIRLAPKILLHFDNLKFSLLHLNFLF